MERLTVSQVATRLKIRPSTWRAYVARNAALKPDGHYDLRTPWWWEETIAEYERTRPKSRAA